MTNYAVVAGHNSIITGASANGYQEHIIARQIKDKVIYYLKQLGERVFDCTDETGRTKQQVWMNAANNCNKVTEKNDFIIAIHLNGGGGTGTEVFDWKGKNKTKCQAVAQRLAKDFSWPTRGEAGWKDGSWIGLLKSTKGQVIYIEVCFIDNITDITKLVRNIDMAAIGIVEEMTGKRVTKPKQEAVQVAQQRDINKVSDWAKKDWEKAVSNGYFDGSRPGANLTREEAAIVVNRLRNNLLALINK